MKLHKILLPALFLSVAFSACNDIEYYVDEPEMPSDGSIAFGGSVSTMASRAQDANTDIIRASSSGFGVMACLTGEEDYNASTADWIPDFMYNQQVTYINSHWHYEPIKYWPASTTEKVSFFAYWPYTSSPEAKDATSSEITALSANDYQGDPILTFHPGTCPTNHIDLLRASSLNKTNEDGTVAFDFAHALSKVGFRLEPWTDGGYLYGSTVTINSLTLTTPYTKATLDLAIGEWVKADNDPNTFDLSGDAINHYDFDPVEDEPFVLNASDSFIYMVPETDSSNPDEYEITVDFTYSNGGLPEQTRTYTTTISPSFEAGVSYMIVMRFGDPDITPTDFIQFSISVEKWDSTPLEARLVAAQEGMHIVGAMYDRPLGRTYTVTGLYCIDSETVSPDENLLKAPKLITSQTFTLEIDEFEFLKMENGKSYRAEVEAALEGEETVEYQDEFAYQWVSTEYTTNAACTEVPFIYDDNTYAKNFGNTKDQAVIIVNGDAFYKRALFRPFVCVLDRRADCWAVFC
ncbi:MAG: fimbrillin family protein [Bacteroidales bacterium]|nr:fimbrillin family protein [Bacteroidales bacterium]